MSNEKRSWWQFLPFLIVPFLLVLPQLITGNMIIGSDALFHFNRFYDCGMQLKMGNFQYFISYYGFHQSARIVNAFYGPAFAYFHGALVMLTGTWFRYQVLANYLLYGTAMGGMQLFLRKLGVSRKCSVLLSASFLATYAVQYWVIRQGFTSWGAAFFPIALIPVVELFARGHLPIRKSALALALMLQVHLFTALLLAVLYFLAVCFQLLRIRERRRLLKEVILAASLFFCVSGNFLGTLFYLYGNHQLVTPFVNRRMDLNTITGNSYYWLLNPLWLLPLLFFAISCWYKHKSVQEKLTLEKFLLFGGGFFVLLSSGVVPWRALVATGNPIIGLIQFPFRFFVPATVLLWGFIGIALRRSGQQGQRLLLVVTLLALIQALGLSFYTLQQWDKGKIIYGESNHVTIHCKSMGDVKAAFYSPDLGKALKWVTKATPDYLPRYAGMKKAPKSNPYQQYQQAVIDRSKDFQKQVKGNKLEITWQGKGNDWREVPVIYYKNTQLRNHSGMGIPFRVTNIGTILVKEQLGENRLQLSFQPPFFFLFSLIGSSVTLVCLGVSFFILKKDRSLGENPVYST